MNVSCTHKDTCLGCYLTDHHNRDGELLLGIYPHSQTDEEAAQELWEELNSCDWDLPEDLTDEAIKMAFSEAVEGVDFRYIDGRTGNRTEADPGEENDGEAAQVWFVLTWHPCTPTSIQCNDATCPVHGDTTRDDGDDPFLPDDG